jgi:excisionase family DNA binding protein
VADWYDFAAAAEKLGIAEGTLRHWVARRQIRHHPLGKLVRFSDADLASALS